MIVKNNCNSNHGNPRKKTLERGPSGLIDRDENQLNKTK